MLAQSFHRIVSIAALLFLGVLIFGCRVDSDAARVDFSNRIVLQKTAPDATENPFKIGIGSIMSAEETAVHYHELLQYIAEKLGRKIKLVQRRTYGEINRLIADGRIDLAFICSGPYAGGKEKFNFEALAIPSVRGSHLYQSYLIVKNNGPIQTLADLRGKVFAFTDKDSNTGKLVPTYWLELAGQSPEAFFGKIIYTHSHDNSIMTVAKSLVDGAAVSGQVWEYYHRRNPVFTGKTRIIRKSESFGNPPVVAASHLPSDLKKRMRTLLWDMHKDPQGKKILDKLMIDRFIAPIEGSYDPILVMLRRCQRQASGENHDA
jgi:phosphonate transport system substrate-binding protein